MRIAIAVLLFAPAWAGCMMESLPETDPDAPALGEPCIDPWPCGDGTEWPIDLVGPFEVAQLVPLTIATASGALDGWAVLPEVPAGTKVPIVLEATPYPGQCYFHNPSNPNCRYHAESPLYATREAYVDSFFHRPLVEAGFAFVSVNLPGTGASEGCFDNYGPATQDALAELVEALAALEWSNGRVGMLGLSASGTSPFAAAIEQPPALKTIVPGGIQSNLYTFSATPQGAYPAEGSFHARYTPSVALGPPLGATPEDLLGAPTRAPERLCEDALAYTTAQQRGATGDRGADFWEPRMLVQRFPDISASVLVFHGFNDAFGSGHAFQEDDVWHALHKAPKRALFGQWEHEYPDGDLLATYPGGVDWWADVAIPWLDYWLKGIGEAPPRLGIADWQDDAGAWHESAAWPPDEARNESLTVGALEFRAARSVVAPIEFVCDSAFSRLPDGAAFVSEPATERAVVAGNAYVHLRLAADAPSGLIEARLYDLAPDLACGADGVSVTETWLSAGAADLRYHAGNLVAADFPVGAPQDVRIDLWNFAHALEPGHRIALILTGPGDGYADQREFPAIALDAASRLVLPVAEGTLGGAPDDGTAPPKPFLP